MAKVLACKAMFWEFDSPLGLQSEFITKCEKTMIMLDATAGNRIMWKGKKPSSVVFMDQETRLARPPDIFADFRFCPFRDKVFECVIFDPPYYTRGNPEAWIFFNPELKIGKYGKNPFNHFGCYKDRRELVSQIAQGVTEFKRITNRLCFKWGEGKLTLWQIMSVFKGWVEVHRREWGGTGHKRKCRNFWVTFVLPPKV